MDRENFFETFISECEKRRQICGQGNPNADILIIGKEHYCCEDVIDSIIFNRHLELNYELCRDKTLRDGPRKRTKNQTWSYYQDLIDMIYNDRKCERKKMFDFEKKAFTTELNTAFRPHAILDERTKNNLAERLPFFEKSMFITSFPVIILACGNFIRNDQKVRQIDSTFHVSFENREDISRNNWIGTHRNIEGYPPQLVVHTRQLSRDVNPELIRRVAIVVRDFLREQGVL